MAQNRQRALLLLSAAIAAYFGWFWFLLRFAHRDVTESCIANVRQSGSAMLMYTQDYDDRLPIHTNWMDASLLYLKTESLFHCPELQRENPTTYGYAFSTILLGRRVTDTNGAAIVPLIFDSSLSNRNACSDLKTLPQPPRHDSHKYNVIFYLDGHAFGVSPSGDRQPPEYFKGSPGI